MPKRSLVLMILVFILALLIFVLWAGLSQQELAAYEPGNYGPYGLKAIDLLLSKAGFQTSVTGVLEDKYDQLLIYTSGLPFADQYRHQILEWVKTGGTILELARFKPQLDPNNDQEKPFILRKPNAACGFYHRGIKLKYHPGGDLIFAGAVSDVNLISKGKRRVVYLNRYGAGRIINWNDPDGITNTHLQKYPDNAVIFTLIVNKYANSRRIVFYSPDSFKGAQNRAKIGDDNYWYGGSLLVIGVIMLLWKLSARFGRPRPLILAKGRSADEFIYSMAALFQQADSKAMVLDNLYRALLLIISKITGLPLDSDVNAMLNRLEVLMGKDYDRQKIFVAIEFYQKYKDRKINTPGFLELAGKLDACRKELNQWSQS
jgi:hypothetical protein